MNKENILKQKMADQINREIEIMYKINHPHIIKLCNHFEDDEYIYSQVPTDLFIVEENQVKIPLSYFIFNRAVTSRMIYKAMHIIGVNKDIENKHIDLILKFVQNSQNGKKLELPLKVSVFKEYDYLTLVNKQKEKQELCEKFKAGSFEVLGFGKVNVKKIEKLDKEGLFVDFDKIPKTAIWRFRKDGDIFEKFGGGTKKLKEFLIDKKIPSRVRNILPVLADQNEVYVVAGVEISDKVKITKNTKKIYKIY